MRYWLKLFGFPTIIVATLLIVGYFYLGRPMLVIHHPRCFGSCPVYSVRVLRDGTILYVGEDFVAHRGIRIGRIDAVQAQRITTSLATLLDTLPPIPPSSTVVTDVGEITMQLAIDGNTRSVTVRDIDGPRVPIVYGFIDQIETTMQIQQWTIGATQ